MSNLRSVLGGTGPMLFSNYYTNATTGYGIGVPGVAYKTQNLRMSQFRGKSKEAKSGLMFRIVNGYFADDSDYFNKNKELNIGGGITDFTNVATATNNLRTINGSDSYSVEWFGWFFAPTTGTYTFYTVSDDASYLWIDSNALSGYTTANATVKNPGLHGMIEAYGTITLTAGNYYPIRIQFGENAGGDDISVSFTPPSGTRTYDGRGYYCTGIGISSAFPAIRAYHIKTLMSTSPDGVYWIVSNGTATQTYCLMDNKWDGGGWMLMMKGTTGTTFNYDSTYWTSSTTTLNHTDLTRNNADAKYGAFNSVPVKDIMALWPDIPATSGASGSVSGQTEAWSWKVNDFVTGLSTMYAGLNNSRDASPSDPTTFSGWNSSYWSTEPGAKRHVFGGSHLATTPVALVRWGFIFNNEADFASSDVFGGIGMKFTQGTTTISYSAGDYYYCCGTIAANTGSRRFELYGR